jgi:glycosyltransferase involved in cell wall biosynthesis
MPRAGRPARVALATDAWYPQTNGVVRTLTETRRCLESSGHEVLVLSPDAFRSMPCPTYPEIRLALAPGRGVSRRLAEFAPDAIHIATEGPVGLAARRFCLRHALAFTTSYHTQFPRYVRMRAPLPENLSYRFLRWFHRPARRTMVPTPAIRRLLEARGFDRVVLWGRGVDTELFTPARRIALEGERPILMYMGRVAVEKNIRAFLDLDVPGTRYVVGDGPALAELKARYPGVVFTGARYGEDLAATVAGADVFVFPSLTDTFGLVLLEAMASGVPVAAYPVDGPVDVVEDGVTGALDEELGQAVERALRLDRGVCRAHALSRSWAAATAQFAGHLVSARAGEGPISSPIRGPREPHTDDTVPRQAGG